MDERSVWNCEIEDCWCSSQPWRASCHALRHKSLRNFFWQQSLCPFLYENHDVTHFISLISFTIALCVDAKISSLNEKMSQIPWQILDNNHNFLLSLKWKVSPLDVKLEGACDNRKTSEMDVWAIRALFIATDIQKGHSEVQSRLI